MKLSCDIQVPPLSVGQIFSIVCDGRVPSPLKLKIDEANKYDLKLLAQQVENNKVQFIFVSYKVGSHQFPTVELQADNQSFEIGPLSFEVKSILNPQEKVEPYGPIGGVDIKIPLIYWVLLGLTLTILFSVIFAKIVSRVRRKRELRKLEEHEVSTSPLQQFYATYRKIFREYDFLQRSSDNMSEYMSESNSQKISEVLSKMDEALRLFLLRRFKISALGCTSSLILKDLYRYQPEFMEYQHESLKYIFKEIDKARQSQASNKLLKEKDLLQIFENVRKFIDHSDQIQDALLQKDFKYLKKLKSAKV